MSAIKKMNSSKTKTLKRALKQLLPPLLVDCIKGRTRYGWFGDYPSWSEASKECAGFDAANILEKCCQSLLKVKNGEAVYERDSILFDHIQYSWAVLAGLLRSAVDNNGKLHVLDFGGSLGSSYYQNREFLSVAKELSWSIVEQKHFVACGKANFEDKVLKFYETIDDCLDQRQPNILLLSSVLPYLPNPYERLKKLLAVGCEYIILDRTSFIDRDTDLIMIQKVSPEIYEASYPCWAFNENKLLSVLTERYRIVADWTPSDPTNYPGMYFKGFILKLK